MPSLEAIDRRAIGRAARGLAPMLRRRSPIFGFHRGDVERVVRAFILARLEAIEDDDHLPAREEDVLWTRVERSGLVLVGVEERAYIVARVAGSGGRASRLLVR